MAAGPATSRRWHAISRPLLAALLGSLIPCAAWAAAPAAASQIQGAHLPELAIPLEELEWRESTGLVTRPARRRTLDGTVGSDRLISLFRRDEPRRYFSLDGLRSVTNLTDDSGAVAASYHLDAWGNYRFPAELDASRNRFGFTGHLFDHETDLYYAKARYFDPTIGRFTSQDSFLGEIDEPPSLHRYFYGNANPTRYVDPTGHQSVPPDDLYFTPPEQRSEEAQQAAGTLVGVLKAGVKGIVATVKGAGHLVAGAFGHERSIAAGKGFLDNAEKFLADPLGNKQAQYEQAYAKAKERFEAGDKFGAGEILGETAGPDVALAAGVTAGVGNLVRRVGSTVRKSAPEGVAFESATQVIPEATAPAPTSVLPAGRTPVIAGGSQGALAETTLAPSRGALEAQGFKLGKHGEMPSPRAGAESHHGVMSRWMQERYPGYSPDKAPAVLMPKQAHDATRGVYNRWRAEMKQQMGGTFDWSKVSDADMRALGDRMFQASKTPQQIQQGYWQWFERMKGALERQQVAR